MIVGLIATLVTVLGLVAQVGGTKMIHRADYQRCLSNITRLENELGIGTWQTTMDEVSQQFYDAPYVATVPAPTKAAIAAQRKESVRVAKYAMARNRP